MSLRTRLSPVFLHEAISGSRRWQGYVLRGLLVLSMLVTLWVAWVATDQAAPQLGGPTRYLSELGRSFYYGVAAIQVMLALLAAPAATAEAVCIDRQRGWLEHMFVTHLSDTEIVLGKLAARLATLIAFVLAGVPVLALAALLGGIIPEAVVILTVVTLSICVLGCSLAMLLSVRATRPHEVLMTVFAFWALWLLALPLWIGLAQSGLVSSAPDWFNKLNPFELVYLPYTRPGSVTVSDVILYVALSAAISLALLVAAMRLVRKEPRKRGEPSVRLERLRRFVRTYLFSWWPSPSLDANPVLWREWHRNRPSRMARLVTVLFVIVTVVGMAAALADAVRQGVERGNEIVGVNMLAVFAGLLFQSAVAPTVLTEERARGSLDVLMATPLPTHRIVLGKWWAAYRRMLPLLILPAFTSVFVASAATGYYPFFWSTRSIATVPIDPASRVMAAILPPAFLIVQAAAVTSLGLAIATWVKRTGLAVAVSVSSFVILSIGWMVFSSVVVRLMLRAHLGSSATAERWHQVDALISMLDCLSPLGAQVSPLDILVHTWNIPRGPRLALLFAPLALVGVMAAALLGLTLLTFNRCMGRMNERARREARGVPADLSHAVNLAATIPAS
jgi:ABC-type transport system involved in multi-copper enzyme maturation permease subunit